jgi:hypothetical protein
LNISPLSIFKIRSEFFSRREMRDSFSMPNSIFESSIEEISISCDHKLLSMLFPLLIRTYFENAIKDTYAYSISLPVCLYFSLKPTVCMYVLLPFSEFAGPLVVIVPCWVRNSMLNLALLEYIKQFFRAVFLDHWK